jgi:hypothetical protein
MDLWLSDGRIQKVTKDYLGKLSNNNNLNIPSYNQTLLKIILPNTAYLIDGSGIIICLY